MVGCFRNVALTNSAPEIGGMEDRMGRVEYDRLCSGCGGRVLVFPLATDPGRHRWCTKGKRGILE